MKLNQHQIPIVNTSIGDTLKTIAGAGTGKTRVLVERYLKFLFDDGIEPDRILALTFTTKAASEMRKRVFEEVLNRGDDKVLRELYGAWIMNFHQFSFRLIKENAAAFGVDPDIGVATEMDIARIRHTLYRKFESGRMDGLPGDFAEDMPEPARFGRAFDRWMNIIAKARNTMWTPKDLLAHTRIDDSPEYKRLLHSVTALWGEYENELDRRNLIDFGGMIRSAVTGLKEDRRLRARYVEKFKHVLVDEYQDTSEAQNEQLRILSGGDFARVTVVGDDKQSIYRWRDARVRNLREFRGENRFLQVNYRSTQSILDLAHQFIVTDPYFKKHSDEIRLVADRDERGTPVCVFHPENEASKSFEDEAKALATWILSLTGRLGRESPFEYHDTVKKAVDYGDIAVLMRSLKPSSGLPVYERELQHAGIPYAIFGGVGSLEVRVLGLLGNLLTVLIDPDDVKAFLGILEAEPFSLPDSALEELFDAKDTKIDVQWLLSDESLARISDSAARESCHRIKSLLEELRIRRANLDLSSFVSDAMELTHYYFQFFGCGADDRLVESVSKILFDLVDELVEKNEGNLAAFLESLQVLLEKKALDDGRGPTFPTGRVRIMTVHAAKGLEFPAVAVPGIKNPPNRKDDYHLSRRSGLFVKEGGDWSRGLADSETFEEETVDREQEERCLLYVAITRAEDYLFVSSPFPNGVERGGRKNLFNDLLKSLEKNDLFYDEFRSLPDLYSPKKRDADTPRVETLDLTGLVADWEVGRKRLDEAVTITEAVPRGVEFISWKSLYTFAQCPLMYYYRNVMGLETPTEAGEDLASHVESNDTDEFSGDVDLPKGVDRKLLGVFVHQLLYEWMSQDEPGGTPYTALLDDLAGRYGFSSSQKRTVIAAVADGIGAFATSPLGTTSEIAWLERPFHLRMDRLLFRGVLDRVDRCKDGFRIIDYKGTTERDEHQFQVEFYAWALSRQGTVNVKEALLCYLQVPTKLVSVDVSQGRLDAIENHATECESATAAGRFEPRPGDVCGSCSFSLVCPAAGNGRPPRSH
ncbi:MAG: ATP-dependent helicase [Candidatus Latescibacterota bacterium]|nr:MAG: ATP-dependent helicase [Candidatus Latescibacterota bacterium]